MNTLETFVTRWGHFKLFKAVGAPTNRLVSTSGYTEKRGSFLSQKANWISSVKTGIKKEEVNSFKLYATGYALVFESIYEVPVDIGCTVFLNFKDDHLLVERDLFHINDDLRSWWIEERDKKLEMVYEEKDPGIAECERRCMHESVCMTV